MNNLIIIIFAIQSVLVSSQTQIEIACELAPGSTWDPTTFASINWTNDVTTDSGANPPQWIFKKTSEYGYNMKLNLPAFEWGWRPNQQSTLDLEFINKDFIVDDSMNLLVTFHTNNRYFTVLIFLDNDDYNKISPQNGEDLLELNPESIVTNINNTASRRSKLGFTTAPEHNIYPLNEGPDNQYPFIISVTNDIPRDIVIVNVNNVGFTEQEAILNGAFDSDENIKIFIASDNAENIIINSLEIRYTYDDMTTSSPTHTPLTVPIPSPQTSQPTLDHSIYIDYLLDHIAIQSIFWLESRYFSLWS